MTHSIRECHAARRLGQPGFTMAELLVAVALGLIILGMVGYCFHHTQRAAHRALAMLEAHHRARVVINLIKKDIEAMHPCCAMQSSATQITFMTCTNNLDRDGEDDTEAAGSWGYTGEDYCYELAWVSYKFENGDLLRGEIAATNTAGTLPAPKKSTVTVPSVFHVVLKDVSGSFQVLDNTFAPTTYGLVSGASTDGSAYSSHPDALRIMNLSVAGNDVGEGGTEVRRTFTGVIYMPWK